MEDISESKLYTFSCLKRKKNVFIYCIKWQMCYNYNMLAAEYSVMIDKNKFIIIAKSWFLNLIFHFSNIAAYVDVNMELINKIAVYKVIYYINTWKRIKSLKF